MFDSFLIALFLIATLSFIIILLIRNNRVPEAPYVEEAVLTYDGLMRHAKDLAKASEVSIQGQPKTVLVRQLSSNYKYIYQAYLKLSEEMNAGKRTVPAAEWILDNFYIVQQQIREVMLTLKRGNFPKLPVMNNGLFKGYPRIYAVISELVSHSDAHLDQDIITSFIQSYQTVRPLHIDELWSIHLMCRLALIASIRRQCEKILKSQEMFSRAEHVFEHLKRPDISEEECNQILLKQNRINRSLHAGYYEQLYTLAFQEKDQTPILIQRLDHFLSNYDRSYDRISSLYLSREAAVQVTMGNAIMSLRNVLVLNFTEMFEALSVVDSILREDPAGVYAEMDFASKNEYRRHIERFARRQDISEVSIARKILKKAQEGKSEKERHVGYYILKKPLYPKKNDKLPRIYFGVAIAVTLVFCLLLAYYAYYLSDSRLAFLLVFVISLIPASDLGLKLSHFIVSKLKKPMLLPKMRFEEGIPESCATVVIISSLVTSTDKAKEYVESLERYYLANPCENLYFAVVGDLKDAPQETTEKDAEILEALKTEIESLNHQYGDRFYAFIRRRQYSEAEGIYMGYERKRGAIMEFTQLLTDPKSDTSFHVIYGPDSMPEIRYVITLDTDTILPMESAKTMIAAMAHPLNTPVISERTNTVVDGYALLQPKVEVSLESANQSYFSGLYGGIGGVDAYSSASFDVYQDLFDEGIFTGKGIFDLRAFHQVLSGAIPDNQVLSHDLLEGSYLHCGLLTDVSFIDSYPDKFLAYTARLHRWIRGDWQVLPWLLGKVRRKDGTKVENPLPAISRFKIFDNLRRSLLMPSLAIYSLLSLFVFPGSNLIWFSFAALVCLFDFLLSLVGYITDRGYRFIGQKTYSSVIFGLSAEFYRGVLTFVTMPYLAFLSVDAIARALYRSFVSKKHLLQWMTAADADKNSSSTLRGYYFNMSFLLLFAAVLLFLPPIKSVLWTVYAALLILTPFTLYQMSFRKRGKDVVLCDKDIQYLRLQARKIWRFFEDIVSEKDHDLPPDNFQEYPPQGIAHRTSPTNIGLYLLSVAAARDFGFIDSKRMLERINRTLDTIDRLEKWNGHLYNWYNTRTLSVLRPRYISTVDSGNFVADLIALAQSLREYRDQPLIGPEHIVGLLDTILIEKPKFLPPVKALLQNEPLEEAFREALAYLEEQDLTGCYMLTQMIDHFRALDTFAADDDFQDTLDRTLTRVQKLIDETVFTPLYSEKMDLFSIGYNVEEDRLTRSYYDLFATEARQTSYIAAARHEVSKKHWLKLGRTLTQYNQHTGLISWTGTMFEYLMPLILMEGFENSLAYETYQFVVHTQIEYARRRGAPWGISESGFYAFDMNLNYQYKAFGVPFLRLKRDDLDDLVIAPYATFLALMVMPKEGVRNLKALEKEGLSDLYGFYEAIDHTKSRQPENGKPIVRSYMAHHQGMSFLSLDNVLNQNILQRRFLKDPVMASARELLEEKVPVKTVISKNTLKKAAPKPQPKPEYEPYIQVLTAPSADLPHAHLLSNGRYSTFLTDDGQGYSTLDHAMLTRFHGDFRSGDYGMFLFIANNADQTVLSATAAPGSYEPDEYRVSFHPNMAEYTRRDRNLEATTQIVVSPEDNVEIRVLTLRNHGSSDMVLDITSYLEPVINSQQDDLAHSAFSNLFVETEFRQESDTLIARRRQRDTDKQTYKLFHTQMILVGDMLGGTQFETDRMRFIGRGRTIKDAYALRENKILSNTQGAVLDPVLSLQAKIRLEGQKTAKIAYITGASKEEAELLEWISKYRDENRIARTFELSAIRAGIEQKLLALTREEQQAYSLLLRRLLFPWNATNQIAQKVEQNRLSQKELWPLGISGDLPMVSVTICSHYDLAFLELVLKSHAFFRMKRLQFDLIILVDEEDIYHNPLLQRVKEAVNLSSERECVDQFGGVFVREKRQLSPQQNLLIEAASCVYLDAGGEFSEQLGFDEAPYEKPKVNIEARSYDPIELNIPPLLFDNHLGGFADEEYVIFKRDGVETPVPWCNVIANPQFGFLVSEAGSGYTYAKNSRENKLSRWTNDAVRDGASEAIYIKDNETGQVFQPVPNGNNRTADYLIRHGFGYTTFETGNYGIFSKLTQFVPKNDPVKLSLLHLENRSQRKRSFTIGQYILPVLGAQRETTRRHIIVRKEENEQTIYLNQYFNYDFSARTAFVDASLPYDDFTADRGEVFARQDTFGVPRGLYHESLTGKTGAGLDSCVFARMQLTLEPGESRDLVFAFGQAEGREEIRRILQAYLQPQQARKALLEVQEDWKKKLGIVRVKTPDPSFDLLQNGWLLYQTISCRIYARSGFYQSGGAYGFRDQLQDCVSILTADPKLLRDQILRCCAHQFPEGDVLHWWHPLDDAFEKEASKGVRTRFSDDLLWLPYACARYLEVTQDESLLAEQVPYVLGEALDAGEDEKYGTYAVSEFTDTVYEHCKRAIERSFQFGRHGLPKMGSGDWNDGMNKVGNLGEGESVFVGWFLCDVIRRFLPIMKQRDDQENMQQYQIILQELSVRLEETAWDGNWYRRAYFDNGDPIGSIESDEAKIDSLSQSWAVLSKIGDRERVRVAMDCVEKYLIDYNLGIIKLLAPPFNNSKNDPGYIRGYVPGVRENGGQYTHAALWVILAYLELGETELAYRLYAMINPINHSSTLLDASRYKVEPYVVAADVYSVGINAGRGGWTWYTGSSGWMYQVAVLGILGIRRHGNTLEIAPRLPKAWDEITVWYQNGASEYEILIRQGMEETTMTVDGAQISGQSFELASDGKAHKVRLFLKA